MTLRPLGLKGRDPLDRRLALKQIARVPKDYEPKERSHPNLQYVRNWRSQPGNSCVGHGVAQAYEVNHVRHGGSLVEPVSRLHVYTHGLLQQTPPGHKLQDEGTFIDYAMAGLVGPGVCVERLFPPTQENVAKRPSGDAEIEGFARGDGDFWQLHGDGTPNGLWREVCWAIDTFGAVVPGKLVGNVYMDHLGESVLKEPGAGEVWVGGHCTVYYEYENYGLTLLEGNSWPEGTWGFSRGVVGSDGKTRQIHSLARASRNWLTHPWMMNLWTWVPAGATP